MPIAPRQAAEIMVTEAKATLEKVWFTRLQHNFEPQFRETMYELVMDHVRHAFVGTKTIPVPLDDGDIPLG